MGQYNGGRVCRIKLQNFLTCDDREIYPSRGLNLIIGHNGAGKSTIVCGICLGLGGKPIDTGKNVPLSSFIKHGKQSALIEIELDTPVRNTVICREITRENKSLWHLNGTSVTIDEVLNIVSQFCIQTSNMCQFLPQDKVSMFAKMDKKQRFENLLQAIGEDDLYAMYQDLIELRVESRGIEDRIKKYEADIDTDEKRNQRLRTEVDKHKETLALREELEVLGILKRILHVQKLLLQHKELKTQKQELKVEADAVLSQAQEKKALLDNVSLKHGNYLKKATSLEGKAKIKINLLKNIHESMARLEEQIDNEKIELKNKIEETVNWGQMLHDTLLQIQALEQKCEASKERQKDMLNEIGILRKKSQECNQIILAKSSQIEIANSEMVALKTTNNSFKLQMEHVKNEGNRRLELLKQKDSQTYEAAMWLSENRHRFKGMVHGPLLTQIDVANEENCKYIESHIPFRDMIAFLCENKDDSMLFLKIARQEKKLSVNCVTVPSQLNSSQPPCNLAELRNFGFTHYLKDLFKAPKAIMDYLCSTYSVHAVPIGDNSIKDKISEITAKTNFRIMYTPDSKISVRRSAYGDRTFSTMVDQLQKPRLLTCSTNTDAQPQIEKRYQEICCQIDQKVNEVNNFKREQLEAEKSMEKMRQQMKELMNAVEKIRCECAELARKKTWYEKSASSVMTEQQLKTQFREKIVRLNLKKQDGIKAVNESLKEVLRLKKMKVALTFVTTHLSEVKKNFVKNCAEMDRKAEMLKDLIMKLKNSLTVISKEFEEHNRDISKQLNDKGLVSTELLSKYPNDLDEIGVLINATHFKLKCSDGSSESAVIEYDNREETIEKNKELMKACDTKNKEVCDKMEGIKEEWLQRLQLHLLNINKKFQEYYQFLKCAGEIILDQSDNTDDFDNYGLKIMLKYREDEDFQELSNTRHSGGECSVAAIIFILSLQELTYVPFRCIDEINQGMDSRNERQVFELIAKSSSKNDSSQYFLLSPTLLPDLEYSSSSNVKIHLLYASSSKEFDLKATIKHLKEKKGL